MNQLDISQITDENIKIFDSINILGLFIVESMDNKDDSDILNKINPWLKIAKEVINQSSKAQVDINSNNILEIKQRVNRWINANNTINTLIDKFINILSNIESESTNIDKEYLKSIDINRLSAKSSRKTNKYYTVGELKKITAKLRLNSKGNKSQLVSRIKKVMK